MCHAVPGYIFQHALRGIETVVQPQKTFPVGIEARQRGIDAVIGVVVATLAVFRLMVDGAAFHFNLAGREIPLKILHVGLGVPQAPLHKRVESEPFRLCGRIAQGHFLYFSPSMKRDEEKDFGFQPVFATLYPGIVHTVPALIAVEFGTARLPSGIPYRPVVVDIKISAAIIHRHAVVTVAGNAAELRVLAKRVTARRIRNQSEEIFRTQIVDPRERRTRVRNHIFPVLVIEISVFHILYAFIFLLFLFSL